MAFGLQNSVIALTPTGRIDSEFPDGNDGSGVRQSWALTPDLSSLQVNTAFAVDLAATGMLIDPGSPSSELGFYTVSGTDPVSGGFSYSGTTLQNSCLRAAVGVFRLVAVRGSYTALSDPIAYSITSSTVVTDTVAPTIPTGITVAQGAAVGTITVTCDAPADLAPANAPASGVAHVDIYVNAVLASPPSPIIAPTNAMVSPTSVNIGSISNPGAPVAFQNGSDWTLTAAGTGIAATASEQCLLVDFGIATGAQRIVALLDAYTSGAGTALSGIMVHETAAAGGRLIAIGLRPSNGTVGLYVISRATTSGTSSQVASQVNDSNGHAIIGPVYVKIERAADNKTLTVSYSLAGLGWTLITTQTITMSAAVHYGLFATSQSAGTEIVGIVEEVAITNPSTLTATVSASAPVSIQMLTVDTQSNSSALSVSITGTPKAASTGNRVNWNPGHYFQVGNENHSNDTVAGLAAGTSDSQVQSNIVISKDTNSTVKGFMGVYLWSQLESTLGNYANAFALIDPMVAWCKARGRTWSVAINSSGNVSSGTTNFGSVPSYLNSTTYGPISGGNHGALYYTSTLGPVTRISNDNVCTRLAALAAALWNRYGSDLFCFMPCWSEMAFVTELVNNGWSTEAIVSAWAKSGGFMDQLRTAMPGTYIYIPPTYLGSGNPALLEPLFESCDRNFITIGNFDSTNESGGSASRIYVGDSAFRGGQVSGGTFQTIPPLVNRVNSATSDFATHHSEDSMGQAAPNNFTGVVPPARIGDGRLNIAWQHDIQQMASHIFWAVNGSSSSGAQGQGPNCNRVVATTNTVAANYSDSSPWASRGLLGFIDFIGSPPRTIKPANWP